MKNTNCMCADPEQARLNRERVARDFGGSWHREQENATKGWDNTEIMPDSIKGYNLPYVNKHVITKHRERLTDKNQ